MFGYANAIRSLSKGRAEYSMAPARFEIVPRRARGQSAGEAVNMKRAGV